MSCRTWKRTLRPGGRRPDRAHHCRRLNWRGSSETDMGSEIAYGRHSRAAGPPERSSDAGNAPIAEIRSGQIRNVALRPSERRRLRRRAALPRAKYNHREVLRPSSAPRTPRAALSGVSVSAQAIRVRRFERTRACGVRAGSLVRDHAPERTCRSEPTSEFHQVKSSTVVTSVRRRRAYEQGLCNETC